MRRAGRLVALTAVLAAAMMLVGVSGAAASPTATVVVQATDSSGVATGVTLVDGQTAVVSATGSWSVGGTYGTFGPAGATSSATESCAAAQSAPMGALIGSLDGGATWFGIGAGTTIDGPGTLLLMTNDCPQNGGIYFGDNSGSVTATVVPGPVASPTATPAANGAGWNNTDVTVDWNWVQGGAALDPSSCPTSTTSSGEGTITLTETCADVAGNHYTASDTVKVDQTAPTITGSASPAPNSAGWNNAPVTVSFTCADTAGGSGIATDTVAGSTLSTDGANQSVTSTGDCVDVAGNAAAPATVSGINIDVSPPMATPVAETPPNANGWYAGDVTIDWNWTDAIPPVNNPLCAKVHNCSPGFPGSGIDPAHCTTATTSTGEGQDLVLTATCTDLAGNTGTATYTVSVDKTPPTLAPTVSPNPVALGAAAAASPNASDATSGIASATCDPVDTSAYGDFTVSCTATDEAGNQASATVSYAVAVQATKQQVLSEIQAAIGSGHRDGQEALRVAAGALQRALEPGLWTDGNHPTSRFVFTDEQLATDALSAYEHQRHLSTSLATVQGWISSLVTADQGLASIAIADATAGSGNARALALASKELARGNAEASHDRANAAIAHYATAWQLATQSGAKHVPDHGGDGKGVGHGPNNGGGGNHSKGGDR